MFAVSRQFLCLLCILAFAQLQAQEQFGLRFDNYSGVNGLVLNPASAATYPLAWDVNLLSIGAYGQTNYGFAVETSLLGIYRRRNGILHAPSVQDQIVDPDRHVLFDYFDNKKLKYGILQAAVTGPSAMIRLSGGHHLGLLTRARLSMSSFDFPWPINFYHFDRTPFFEPIHAAPFRMSGAAWGEIGLNYGWQGLTENGIISFGATVKWLHAYEGFYMDHRRDIEVIQYPGDTLSFSAMDGMLAFTEGNTNGGAIGPKRSGGGWGVDLGVLFTLGGDETDYRWRLGFSLLDIGQLRFRNHAAVHQYQTDETTFIHSPDYAALDRTSDAYSQKLSKDFLGEETASKVDNQFNLWLPSGISVQADLAISEHFYLNSALIQRLPLNSATVLRRSNLLVSGPRFESRWFGIGVPVSLLDWRTTQVGLNMRMGFVNLGSDNLGSIFGKSTFTGTDFYIALKINPFQMSTQNSSLNVRRKGKKVKCYNF